MYDLLLISHVFLMVYWLGADLGVLYGAGYAANPDLSPATRATVAKIMAWLDLFPRLSVPLIGAVGATLGLVGGYLDLSAIWIPAVWVVAAIWLAVTIYMYKNKAQPDKIAGVKTFDVWFRSAVMVLVMVLALTSLVGFGPASDYWLVLKLFFYGAAIFMSLMIRVTFAPFRPALANIVAGNGTEADDETMALALRRARSPVLLTWGFVAAAAAVGIAK